MSNTSKRITLSDNASPREIMKRLAEAYPNKAISPSYLRLETETVNTTRLDFTISNDTGTKTSAERRLQRNDLFFATHVGFFIKKVASGVHGNSLLYTYPNGTQFADNSTTFLQADLESLWNGFLQIKTGSTITVEALDTQRFRNAPMLPQGTTNAAIAGPVLYPITQDSRGPKDGILQLDSFLQFLGTEQHEISLTIPDGSTMKIAHTAANTDVFITLVFQGWLVKNVIQN